MSFWNLGLGGSGGFGSAATSGLGGSALQSLLGGGGSGSSDPSVADLIAKYSYMPQYTGQTEQGLYNLFNQTNGSQGLSNIPFDLGLDTNGLYDANTRGILQSYLGTPGGPQGGRIADLQAQANNMGIPEYGLNQTRLANQDLNNSLLDEAAKINNATKDRLTQILGLGANVGSNLYAQDLAQQRYNTGAAIQGGQFDAGLNQAINSANQSSLSSLLSGAGALATTAYTGNPALGSVAGSGINALTGGTSTTPATVLGSGSLSANYSPYSGTGYGLGTLGQNQKTFT